MNLPKQLTEFLDNKDRIYEFIQMLNYNHMGLNDLFHNTYKLLYTCFMQVWVGDCQPTEC